MPLDPPIVQLEGDELAWAWRKLAALAADVGSSMPVKALPPGCGGLHDLTTLAIDINESSGTNPRRYVVGASSSCASARTSRCASSCTSVLTRCRGGGDFYAESPILTWRQRGRPDRPLAARRSACPPTPAARRSARRSVWRAAFDATHAPRPPAGIR